MLRKMPVLCWQGSWSVNNRMKKDSRCDVSPPSGGFTASIRQSLEVVADGMVQQIRALQSLCDNLENVADELAQEPDRQTCLHIARALPAAVRDAHHFEETQVFPLLKSTARETEETLARLWLEHVADESYADELAEALRDHVAGRGRLDAEALGYMLRGFFEGLRRHLAFELEHVVPVLRQAAKVAR